MRPQSISRPLQNRKHSSTLFEMVISIFESTLARWTTEVVHLSVDASRSTLAIDGIFHSAQVRQILFRRATATVRHRPSASPGSRGFRQQASRQAIGERSGPGYEHRTKWCRQRLRNVLNCIGVPDSLLEVIETGGARHLDKDGTPA